MLKYLLFAACNAHVDLDAHSSDSVDLIHNLAEDMMINEDMNYQYKHHRKSYAKKQNHHHTY
jgi:hypothetical protein